MVVMFQKIELVLVAVGLLLLAVWGVARFHGAVSAKTAIAEFEAARAENLADSTSPSLDRTLSSPLDFRLWSPKRIAAYKVSLAEKTDLPLATLRIPKINLEVPVFNDTDDLTLDGGVGRILGTARVGQPGNLGIAGHRDGVFRGLQRIAQGRVAERVQPRHTGN